MRIRLAAIKTIAIVFLAVAAGGAQAPVPVAPAQERPETAAGDVPKTATGRIAGRVVAADSGTPLARARVRLIASGSQKPASVRADARGRFEFSMLPPGEYVLYASKPGFVDTPFGGGRLLDSPKRVVLRKGEAFDKANFALERSGVITGRVVDEFGDVVTNASVMAMRYADWNGERRLMPTAQPAQTNDIGQFRVFGLEPADYYLSVSVGEGDPEAASGDGQSYLPTYYPGTPNLAEAQAVSVRSGQEQSVGDLPVTPSHAVHVSGTVVTSSGRPLRGGYAFLRLDFDNSSTALNFSGARHAELTEDGTFILDNVAPGEYVLEAAEMSEEQSSSESGSVQVTVADDDVTGIMLVLSPGTSIAGRIVVEGQTTGLRADRLMVTLESAEATLTFMSGSSGGAVKDDWTFVVPHARRTGVLRLQDLPAGWVLKSVVHGGQDITDTPIALEGKSITEVEIVLSNRVTEITGSVADERGKPVKDYTVVAFSEDSSRWGRRSRFISSATADQAGRFTLAGLPPERYLLVALESTAAGQSTDPAFLENARSGATAVTLGEGEKKAVQLKLDGRR